MERDSTGTAEKTEPASPLGKNMNQDTCAANSNCALDETCGTTDVAKARWTLLRQVLSKGIPNLLCFQAVWACVRVFQMCCVFKHKMRRFHYLCQNLYSSLLWDKEGDCEDCLSDTWRLSSFILSLNFKIHLFFIVFSGLTLHYPSKPKMWMWNMGTAM